MKQTIICISSNRSFEKQTLQTVTELSRLGAVRLFESGSSDVSFARNRALSGVCKMLRDHPDRDVVLMLDDDMAVQPSVARAIVEHARSSGEPTSAAYCTGDGKHVAATRWSAKPSHWLVGLGCLAIPRARLLELEQRSDSFELNGEVMSEFTWSCAEGGKYYSEDFRLSMNLGGVVLLPLAAGHVKKGVLLPDEITLERIRDGLPLENDS